MAAFKANDKGFRAAANGPGVRKALAEVAEKGKAYAESISQGFRREANPEDVYADSFEVKETTVEFGGAHPGPRAAVEVRNTSGHAAAVEYGYKGRSGEPGSSAHRVLGRTLEFLAGGG